MKNILWRTVFVFGLLITGILNNSRVCKAAEYYYDGDWCYSLYKDGAYIRRYIGNDTVVSIPSKLGNNDVTGMWSNVFAGTKVQSVTLSATVNDVASGAFDGGTDSKHHVVTSTIINIYVDPGNQNYTSMDGVLFSKDKKTLLNYPEGRTDNVYMIPDGTVLIGEEAFCDSANLETVYFPESVRILGKRSLSGMDSLKYIALNSGMERIEEDVFQGCYEIESISIPKSVTYISDSALSYTDKLMSLTVENGNANYITVDNVLFNASKTRLLFYPSGKTDKTYTVPSSVAEINNMSRNSYIEHISLPEGLKVIGKNAFSIDLNLQDLVIPDDVESIGEQAFFRCESLTEITLPYKFSGIEEYMFYLCNKLSKLTIKNKDCYIYKVYQTVGKNVILCGYANSTAYHYAKNFGRIFEDIETGIQTDFRYDLNELADFLPRNIKYGEPVSTMISYSNQFGDFDGYSPAIAHEFDTTNPDYVRLKNFTDDLVKDCKSDYDKVKTIVNWVYKHMTYQLGSIPGNTIHSVYILFDRLYGNCMCYTQLTNYMLYLEDINCAVVDTPGHEYCAVLIDDKWYCADASNNVIDSNLAYYGEFNSIIFSSGIFSYRINSKEGVFLAAVGYDCDSVEQLTEITLPDNIAGIYGHALYFVDENAVLKGVRGSVADKFLQSTDNYVITYSGNIFLAKRKEKNAATSMDISKTKVLLEKTSYTYNGSKKKPGVTVVMNGRKLTDGLDYRISYQNNTKVGTASVKINGIGNYTGQKIKKFQIIPKGTQVKGKIMAKHKAFTLNWKKQKSVSGYVIQYSTSRKFAKKKTQKKIVKKSSKTNLTVQKLKAKRIYYVRIRTYKTVKGKKYYSKWSEVKYVKTKK